MIVNFFSEDFGGKSKFVEGAAMIGRLCRRNRLTREERTDKPRDRWKTKTSVGYSQKTNSVNTRRGQ
eukprot:755246-Hanusia_phi.AAC.3